MSSTWNRTVTQAGGLNSAHGEALYRQAGGVRAPGAGDATALRLFCEAFGWQPTLPARPGFDATATDGTRYCVRGCRVSAFDTSGRLSAIRGLSDARFDALAFALLDANDQVLRAAILPAQLIPEFATFDRPRNAHIVHISETAVDDARVRDVTSDLQAVRT